MPYLERFNLHLDFFIEPLEQEFGWSRTQVNVSLSIGVVSSFLAPFIGNLMDRFGAKWTMATSLLLVATAFFLRSVMTELWQFYLFSGVMFAGTPGATMMPAGRLVLTWFPKARGRMMGIVTSGNNIGSGTAVPIRRLALDVGPNGHCINRYGDARIADYS